MRDSWEILAAVSSFVQAVAVVIALLYAANQLREAGKDRHLALLFRLSEMFDHPKARAARFHVFNKLPTEPGTLSREDYEAARDSWNLMNSIGVVAHHDLVSRKILLDLISRQAIRLWFKLEPHILYYRRERGYFAGYFEELAKLSSDYRKKRYGEDQPAFYEPQVFDSEE